MLQLRTYTLRSSDALRRYADVHWQRHLATFAAFGVSTHAVWTDPAAHRLFAMIGYPPDTDPDEVSRRVMASPQFAADMAGFDVTDILAVHTTLLEQETLP